MKLVDANVILRFLVKDNTAMYKATQKLFDRVSKLQEKLEVK